MNKYIRANDWKIQLAILCQKKLETPFENVVQPQLHIERDMYEHWRNDSTENKHLKETADTEDTSSDTDFSFTFEM